MRSAVYLDHNATTPVHERVLERMLPYLGERFGNPSSGHPLGWEARGAVEDARERVAALLGCSIEEIFFTSGGTESNNLAILGAAGAAGGRRAIATTAVEHPATEEPCRVLEGRGWRVSRVGVDGEGLVDAEEVGRAIGEDTALVTVMHANNETGAIQPVAEIARIARARGAAVHTDAAQSAGKVPVRVDELGADLASIAGHKLYAPKGIGALYVRRGTAPPAPVLAGAGQERGVRPGTENVAGIVGLGAACELALETMEEEAARVAALRDDLWLRLSGRIPGLALNGPAERRLPNTLNVRFPGVRGSALLARTDEVAASTGAACHEGGDETPSRVILAMGIPPEEALCSVRLTLGRSTTSEGVALAARALERSYREIRGG